MSPRSPWADAVLAAALFATDPHGTGGVLLRAHAGPVRDRWLALVRTLMPHGAPWRRVPIHVTDGRLLGGLDLAATLRSGRPVAERGLLAEADGGALVLAMAERVAPGAAARIAAALDTGEAAVERDGLGLRLAARFGVLALDEGASPDERTPAVLADRLAFPVDLTGLSAREAHDAGLDAAAAAQARSRLARVRAADCVLEALVATAAAIGIGSMRIPLLALRAARAAAALAGRDAVAEEDASLAGRLVLAPRATALPPAEPPSEEPRPDAPDPPGSGSETERPDGDGGALADIVLEATQAAIPPGLLAELRVRAARTRMPSAGRAGAVQRSRLRGRPTGTRAGDPRGGARLNVVETLRAAAPWQPLRRRERGAAARADGGTPRVEVRREDFRVTRFRQRAQTTTIFVVDASGSAALHRLSEAKGAVELLLADAYVRRDRVALVAFRGKGAELLLPPTRSLARAKRSLAALPGGGGTPLAAGIDVAAALAEAVGRRGETPVVVLLTDGRANVARDGGRTRAEEEALAAARVLRDAGVAAMVVDTSPRPQPLAGRLAAEMGARYLPLPHVDSAKLSRAVRASAAAAR
ncbi:MAG: magnesium chelatase subunit D [Burkholderiales bacterium]|nr:magnesium chelatase subunit D [Burkholderiales bacterium]